MARGGGDAFDDSLDGDTLHLAVFDGMGHGLGAAILASVALAAYRNARRGDRSLLETAEVVDAVRAERFGDDSFVTGAFARLDLTTGSLSLLCAAHPAPLLVRDGRPVGEVSVEPGPPLGFGVRDDSVGEVQLQPGDRLLMFSDGVVEARSAEGEFFGLERLVDLVTRQEANRQPPPETLRRLIVAVLEHQQNMLQDDATVLMLEWAGDPRALLPSPLQQRSRVPDTPLGPPGCEAVHQGAPAGRPRTEEGTVQDRVVEQDLLPGVAVAEPQRVLLRASRCRQGLPSGAGVR